MIMREWRRKDKEFNKSTIEVNLLLKDHHEMEPETDHQENIQRVLKFHARFSSIFESLSGFSKASVNMYSDLIAYINNASATKEEISGNPFA
ncbi:hypothetical protein JRO89_XS08G0119100 [Xanthoceras sorbifolium]|uniref:Uncharacterized protein n=1 Tax=Xanthoceras sorbifolium TaxID=99658 RepID=A0ABQ8HPI4_9ROSI|nr:hypothetical protein JRO89_XS08G0119100 [Xanthoceras sorbifolium]